MRVFYNPPKILYKMFPKFVWESKVDKILLTFDDGPNPGTTELILERLNKFNIKALFFCVGENVKKYPDLIEKIISEGHIIGNHSYSHRNITLKDKSKVYEQIELCSKILIEQSGIRPQYFRPPHGRFDLRTNMLMEKHQLTNVMWSLLTYDYKNDLNIVKLAVQNYLTKRSIVVLHDNNKSKDVVYSSINFIVEEVGKRGVEFGKPSECLR